MAKSGAGNRTDVRRTLVKKQTRNMVTENQPHSHSKNFKNQDPLAHKSHQGQEQAIKAKETKK